MNDKLKDFDSKEFFKSDWLKPDDIPPGGAIMKISEVDLVETRVYGKDDEFEDSLVIRFEGDDRQLAVNKTRDRALREITGTSKVIEWIGHEIHLMRGTANNGKATIDVYAPAQPTRGLAKQQKTEVEEVVFPVS